MSRSEIAAWNTGVDVARAETDPQASARLVAYLTGAARAQLGRGISTFLLLSRADLGEMLSEPAFDALDRLTRDVWAYWVREGYERARAELGR